MKTDPSISKQHTQTPLDWPINIKTAHKDIFRLTHQHQNSTQRHPRIATATSKTEHTKTLCVLDKLFRRSLFFRCQVPQCRRQLLKLDCVQVVEEFRCDLPFLDLLVRLYVPWRESDHKPSISRRLSLVSLIYWSDFMCCDERVITSRWSTGQTLFAVTREWSQARHL